MKVIQIDKKNWGESLKSARSAYRLFGPVKEEKYHNFRELAEDALPDLDFQNTKLSPKSMVYPQSEVMFEYSLDENDPDHHQMKEPQSDDSPRAFIGIRPCDAYAFLLQTKF